jgi:hypothetical protein
MFDSCIEMFEFVIPELTNYVFKKQNAGMSEAL